MKKSCDASCARVHTPDACAASHGTVRRGFDVAAICASALVASAAAPRVRAVGVVQCISATVPQCSLVEGAKAGREYRHKLERFRCAGAWAFRHRFRQRSSTWARGGCLGGASLDTARRSFLGAARAAGSGDCRRSSRIPAQDRAEASAWAVRRFPCG